MGPPVGSGARDVVGIAWVQAFVGTEWLDLDPTLGDAVEGHALVDPVTVLAHAPPRTCTTR